MKEDKKLNSIFRTYPEIKLVDLFGSMATGSEGPLSDYDFAIYLDTKDKTRIYEIKADMIVRIGKLLKTDSIDVVIMSSSEDEMLLYRLELANMRKIKELEILDRMRRERLEESIR